MENPYQIGFQERVRRLRQNQTNATDAKRGVMSPMGNYSQEEIFVPKARAPFGEMLAGFAKTIGAIMPRPQPAVAAMPAPATPTPVENRGPVKFTEDDATAEAIRMGYKNWGSPPAANYANHMVTESNKYPAFRANPFMLPALTILETAGGQKTKMPNNFTNWGIYQDWQPSSPEEALSKTASGIGVRTPYYQKFRDTGSLEDFSNVYAPESDNPGTGGNNYARNMRSVMSVFQKALQEIKARQATGSGSLR